MQFSDVNFSWLTEMGKLDDNRKNRGKRKETKTWNIQQKKKLKNAENGDGF